MSIPANGLRGKYAAARLLKLVSPAGIEPAISP